MRTHCSACGRGWVNADGTPGGEAGPLTDEEMTEALGLPIEELPWPS